MSEKKTDTVHAPTAISDETMLKITKEIVVKFIEVGKLSPANFEETFARVHSVIKRQAGRA